MNAENKESFFYHENQNINNIKNLRLYINNPLTKIKPKKFLNNTVLRKKYTLISPSSFSNNPNRKNHIIIQPESQNNNINDQKIFNYVNTDSEDNFSFEHPKICIKLNSPKKNIDISNNLSSEKNNKSNKYKIRRIKPKNLHSNERIKTNKINKKINNSNINSIQNSFDSSDNNFSFCQKKNQEYSNINNYCNMTQEKYLTDFNDSIDNIVKEQTISSYINTRNNINQNKNKINNNIINNKINKTNFVYNNNINNELNNLKKIVYKKKIRKKNNYSETFSHYKILSINKQKNKKNLISPYENNDLNSNLSTNKINQNKIYKLIYNTNETPQKFELLPKNNKEYKYINSYYNKKTSIILPSYTLTEPIVTNLNNNNKKGKEYIKIENYNNNSFEINNNNNENNTKILGLLISENKRKVLKKKEKDFPKKYNSTIRRKKVLDFSSTKSSTDMLINVNKYNTNYFYGNNILNNNYLIENSNSFSNYNTVNSLNNTENNINYFNNDINIKLYPYRTLTYKYFVPDYKNKMFSLQNELLNNKINKIGKKKLKNVITSIEYENDDTNNEFDKKKVILSEFDKNGKLNIKFKKMNKSIEKIIKENSNPKIKKVYYLKPSKLTYIKKNQGTHIKKAKKFNTIYKI